MSALDSADDTLRCFVVHEIPDLGTSRYARVLAVYDDLTRAEADIGRRLMLDQFQRFEIVELDLNESSDSE